jgi:hypothetical protein
MTSRGNTENANELKPQHGFAIQKRLNFHSKYMEGLDLSCSPSNPHRRPIGRFLLWAVRIILDLVILFPYIFDAIL